jgi:hypothetical protein
MMMTVNDNTFNSDAVVNWIGLAQTESAYRGDDPRFSHLQRCQVWRSR